MLAVFLTTMPKDKGELTSLLTSGTWDRVFFLRLHLEKLFLVFEVGTPLC